MTQYLIAVYDNPETFASVTREQMEKEFAAVDVVNQRMRDAGVFVFAGGMHGPDATTTVDGTSGKVVVTDGPHLETKEYLGGFWILELPDLDAALAWAKEATVACNRPLEVRPFHAEDMDPSDLVAGA